MPGQNIIVIKEFSSSPKMATQIRPFLEMGLEKLANKRVFIPIGSLIQKTLPLACKCAELADGAGRAGGREVDLRMGSGLAYEERACGWGGMYGWGANRRRPFGQERAGVRTGDRSLRMGVA